MCIIISKPAGIACPDWETLLQCWIKNPDGAGYMFAYRGKVHIRKGFMCWDELMESVNTDWLKRCPTVFHFRWATHGSKSTGNTHPFPIDAENMKSVRCSTDVGIAHNGIITSQKITEDDYSDTMSFIHAHLIPYWKWCKSHGKPYMFASEKERQKLLDAVGCKWSFLHGDGTLINIGQGIEQIGIWYSNYGFMTNKRRMTSTAAESKCVSTPRYDVTNYLYRNVYKG
jgi:hypothetical protein